LQDLRDAYDNSAKELIDGLNKQLSKEKQMYSSAENKKEVEDL